jgi:hypothetical protein
MLLLMRRLLFRYESQFGQNSQSSVIISLVNVRLCAVFNQELIVNNLKSHI